MYLRVELRPSRMLNAARTVMHAVAMLSLPWVDLHGGLRVGVALLIVANFLASAFRARPPNTLVFIDGAPRLLIQERVIEVDLQEYYYCTELLLVLHFRERQLPPVRRRRHCLLILPDTSNARSRRRLRTLLRWHGAAASPQICDEQQGA